MRPRSDVSPRQAGFTLTEQLVALFVLSLVGLLLLQGVGAATRLWRRSGSDVTVAETIQSAEQLLRSRLESTYLETQTNAIPPYPYFDGLDNQLTFYATAPRNNASAALRRYTISVTAAGDLILSSRDSVFGLLPDAMVPPPLIEVLLHGVQSIDIAYFEVGHGWQRSWQMRSHPPALVRLQLRFPLGDHRWWPDLIVHPIATVDRQCVLSISMHGCMGRS